MENLEVDGEFWLVDDSERKVAGHLTYNRADGLNLSLIGSLHEPDNVIARARAMSTGPTISVPLEELYGMDRGPVRILGETTKGPITLEDCVRQGASFPFSGRSLRENYRGSLAVLGANFGKNEPLVFSGMELSVHNLEHWVRKPGISIEFDLHEDSGIIGQTRITNTPLEKIVTRASIGELELSFSYKLRGDHVVETVLEQSCAFGVRCAQLLPYADLLKMCSAIRDLVTIGLDAPSSITGLSFQRPKETLTPATVPGDSESVRLYGRFLGDDIQGNERVPRLADMLFTLDGIGGLDGVARWLEVAETYEIVIGSLVTYWYAPTLYTEHRFFSILTAAESLERIRLNQQNFNLKKGLKRLACDAGDTFETLVGDVDAWTSKVVRTRMNTVVHPGLRGKAEGSYLYFLSESIYFLVVLCLLRECNVPEDSLCKVQNLPRFLRLKRELKSLI